LRRRRFDFGAKRVSRVAQWKRIQTLAVAAGIWGAVQPALANCDAEMRKLTQDRNVQLQIVKDFAKAAHGKPMDSTAFCVKSAGLIRAESALIAYMEKNKDWCSFPDEAINQLKEHHARNADFNAKACSVALTLKKMREPAEQDSGGWPRTVVPLVPDGGSFTVPVTINGRLTLNFVVDSGASDVSVPADVVMTLVRTGTITDSDFLGKQTYQMADGSTVPSQRFNIRSLTVGDRTLENVVGSIAPVAGSLLLGQSFLSRFKSVSMDYERRALILK
jgi:predicted aspartyl protease